MSMRKRRKVQVVPWKEHKKTLEATTPIMRVRICNSDHDPAIVDTVWHEEPVAMGRLSGARSIGQRGPNDDNNRASPHQRCVYISESRCWHNSWDPRIWRGWIENLSLFKRQEMMARGSDPQTDTSLRAPIFCQSDQGAH